MNELYTVTNFLVDKAKESPLVNTISFEKTSEIDPNKENIYPLVNVDLVDSDPVSDTLVFNYIVTILQQRDYDNEANNDKELNQDNLIDNLNECYSIITRTINSIENNYNYEDIEIKRKSNITVLKAFGRQSLDGIRMTLSLEIENKTAC